MRDGGTRREQRPGEFLIRGRAAFVARHTLTQRARVVIPSASEGPCLTGIGAQASLRAQIPLESSVASSCMARVTVRFLRKRFL